MMSDETKRNVDARLRRVLGQVGGLQRMVDEDRYCVDVLVQIAATRAALERAGQIVLRAHIETCVAEAFESGRIKDRDEKIAELMEVFARFAHIGGR